MESVLKLYGTNIQVLKLMDWLKRVLRILFVVILVVCMYINCICGVRLIQEKSVSKPNTSVVTTSIPDSNSKEQLLEMLKELPHRNVSYDYTGLVIPPKTFGEDHYKGMKDNDIVEERVDYSAALPDEESSKDIENPESTYPYPTLIVHGNGGFPEITEILLNTNDISVESLVKPKRLGKEFDKWYADSACTIPFTNISTEMGTIDIYAGWKEFRGFLSDDEGFITGYTDPQYITFSGELVLPVNESCLGVREGAFSGLEDLVEGVYIPKNIAVLPEGVFNEFPYLMYIQVEAGNPVYKSVNGVLYKTDGTLVCNPQGQTVGNSSVMLYSK